MTRAFSPWRIAVVAVTVLVIQPLALEPARAAESMAALPMEQRFTSVSPARAWDSRFGPGPTGRVGAGQTREITVTGVGGVPATGVAAVVLNVTAVFPSAATFVTTWPTGETKPMASSLNVPSGDVRGNLVIAKVGAGGKVSFNNFAGNVHLVADIAGWYKLPPTHIPDAPPGSATAYQVNPSHDGRSSGTLTLPATAAPKWSHDFGTAADAPSPIGYPLKVGSRVFATVNPSPTAYGTDLHALDAATGATLWGPIPLGGVYHFAGLTADSEAVYSLNHNGRLQSYDQATGQLRWSTDLPGQRSFDSPPTVSGGLVYTGGAGQGSTLYAVDSRTGAVRWTAPLISGSSSSPAVADGGVYVSYACPNTYRFDATTGVRVWDTEAGCFGGGGRTPVVHGDSVYIRDWASYPPRRLSRATGETLGTFNSLLAPAFSGDVGFFVAPFGDTPSWTIAAINQVSGTLLWTATGDGRYTAAPVVIDGKVIVGSTSGAVTALDEHSGAHVWSANAGSPIHYPNEHDAVQVVGLNVADGLLLVPTATALVAYG